MRLHALRNGQCYQRYNIMYSTQVGNLNLQTPRDSDPISAPALATSTSRTTPPRTRRRTGRPHPRTSPSATRKSSSGLTCTSQIFHGKQRLRVKRKKMSSSWKTLRYSSVSCWSRLASCATRDHTRDVVPCCTMLSQLQNYTQLEVGEPLQ